MKQPPSSRDVIVDRQTAGLRKLLAAVFERNAFYREKFGLAGLQSVPETIAELVESFPFTQKPELVADQAANPPYGTNLTFPLEDYNRIHSTSGTTAAPLRWLDTPESWSWLLDGWTRVLDAAAVTKEDRVFFPFSFGPFCGFWMAFDAAVRMGCLTIPGGGMRTEVRLRAIAENRATVVCATPTYAIRLGEAAREGGDLSSVRVLVVAGEPGGSVPATRALLEELWPSARVFDHHGMTEVGPVTYECPQRPGRLHVLDEHYLAEVVDPISGRPVGPGGTGELVLTALGRTASPAIRYRTRDCVQLAEEPLCPACGTPETTFLGGILARADDMVVVRGVNLFPSAVEEVVRSTGGVAEYRVEVRRDRGMYDVHLLVEPQADGEPGAALAQRVGAALNKAFGLRFSVEPAAAGQLPRFEAKSKRWVRVDS